MAGTAQMQRKLIKDKKDLKEWIEYETRKHGKRSYLNFLEITEKQVLIKHIILLRKTEYHYNKNNKLLYYFYKVRLLRFQNKYSMHIPINTCGKGLKIMHVGPVLINGNARIGKDVSIHINTAIAAKGINDLAPKIDDNCVIGVGSVILGDVYIAKNVAVGANAVVTKSIFEEDIAIAGMPAKKVSENGRTKWGKGNNDNKRRSKK